MRVVATHRVWVAHNADTAQYQFALGNRCLLAVHGGARARGVLNNLQGRVVSEIFSLEEWFFTYGDPPGHPHVWWVEHFTSVLHWDGRVHVYNKSVRKENECDTSSHIDCALRKP